MSSNKNWHTLVLEKLYTLPAKHSLLLEFCKDFNQMDNFDTILINQLTHYLSTLQLKIKWTSNKISQQGIVLLHMLKFNDLIDFYSFLYRIYC